MVELVMSHGAYKLIASLFSLISNPQVIPSITTFPDAFALFILTVIPAVITKACTIDSIEEFEG